MSILKEKIQNFYNFVRKIFEFFQWLHLEFKTTREIFHFWRLENFLRKSRRLKKTIKYLRKDIWIVWENTSTWQICVSYLHINSVSVTYILMLYSVVFFVPKILKVVLYKVNDKLPTNYEMGCELQMGFCSKFPE